MNKIEFYNENILEGPVEDPYTYAASLLPPSLREEYESARIERSRYLYQLKESLDNTGDKTLITAYMDCESVINNFHTLACAAMFLYGAELMEKECAQTFGSLALAIANELSSK